MSPYLKSSKPYLKFFGFDLKKTLLIYLKLVRWVEKLLYGIGLGPGDRKLITLKAVEVIKAADEVIVPGTMAYNLIKNFCKARIVEFPMRRGKEIAKSLAAELAERSDENIAFCCLGDPVFYSTFHHVASELLKIKPNFEIEIIPGISSISCALAKAKLFVTNSAFITTQEFNDVDIAVVLKAKKPKEIEIKLREMGFMKFLLIEKMFMDERIHEEMPEKADYFSVLLGWK
jgi:precorrin-2/cobalt-factor-2 C20-methyltransferase